MKFILVFGTIFVLVYIGKYDETCTFVLGVPCLNSCKTMIVYVYIFAELSVSKGRLKDTLTSRGLLAYQLDY